ncbi:aminopeptidase [Akkermansiaceae bacterium]|nr:aminopeptidase [Akkermansiaceae bacterium]
MRRVPLLALFFLGGCQTLHFYGQGVRGQAEILRKSRPNAKLLAAPGTSAALREKLLLAQELCDFASEDLALPGDSSYHRYADLGRRHVVFVLYAAREFSLEPKTWRYPIIGELDYRGYFEEEDALAYAEKLRAEGYEIHLGGTNAYSTLGVFHDPLLNTFIDYPEIDFAELIFHELTHRRIFRKGDTSFNESLANLVQEEGTMKYLRAKGRTSELADYGERLARRRDFYAEIEVTRVQLEKLYRSPLPEAEMRERKQAILSELKSRARALQARWGTKALEGWLEQDLTNAHLLALITYNSEMPRFRKLLEDSGGDFDRFFREIENEQ